MWIPTSEDEIRNVVTSGSIEESIVFEAKSEVSTNVNVAKTVSAMANTAGGVIIYGIGEDDNGRPRELLPIPIKGMRERIDGVVRTSISGPPFVRPIEIVCDADPSKGYLIVHVPPSDGAPHMVIVNGEKRYYGRGETGNYILSEPEIAQLYDRRKSTKEEIWPFLDEAIKEAEDAHYNGVSHLHVVARPVLRNGDILENAIAGRDQSHTDLLRELVKSAKEQSVFPDSFVPDFMSTDWARKTDGYITKMWDRSPETPHSHSLHLEVGFDGSARLFCSRAAQLNKADDNATRIFISSLVAGLPVRFFHLIGELFTRSQYFGLVDVAVAVTRVDRSICLDGKSRGLSDPIPYDKPDFRNHKRVSAQILNEIPVNPAEALLMPLFDAISQGTVKPYENLK